MTEPTVVSEPVVPGRARLEPGRRLGDRYVIRAVVGAGGMGTVYRATDEVLGEDVALKIVADRAALRDEVKLAQKVTHENVCRTYDLEDIDGLHVLKMELVEGESLAAIGGKLPIDRALAIARGIAAGLAAAHAQGIVHRDLKPGNVMLAGPRVVLMDFGLASASTEATLSGTPGYMAPEQLAGADIDRRADLYALGCVLYEMLAGAPVFDGTTIERAARHASTPPPDVRRVRPEVPRWLAGAIAQLLAKAPAKRPAGLARLLAGPRRATIPLAIALVIVSAIAIGLVAREKPDDPNRDLETKMATAQRELADERTENTVEHARRLLDTAPEAAVALVAALASGPHWVEARAIAAAARAHGLASSMPAPASGLREFGRSVMLDRSGTHLLAVGNGGEVEDYDLTARTHRTRVVLDDHEGGVMYAPDGRIVAMTKTGLSLVDGDRLRPIASVHGGRLLAIAGALVYWHDRKTDEVWRLDLDGVHAPVRVADVVGSIAAVAPDGHHVAIAGSHAVSIVDAGGAPVRVAIDDAHDLAWSPDGTRLAIATTYHVAIVENGKIVLDHDYSHEDQTGLVNGVAFVDDELFAATVLGARRPESEDRLAFDEPTFSPVAIRDGFVATVPDGHMLVYGAGYTLVREPGRVFVRLARPDAPYIVGVGTDRVYWWSVDDLVPRRLDVTFVVGAHALDRDHVAVADTRGLSLYDLDTGRGTVIASASAPFRFSQQPGGDRAAVLDADGHVVVFDAKGHAETLAGKADQVWWMEPHELLIQHASAAEIYDLDSKATSTVSQARIDLATSQPGWIAAVTATGTLWRLERATNRVETAAPLVDNHEHDSVLTPNGTLLVSSSESVLAWLPDQPAYTVGTIAGSIVRLVPYRGGALAITAHGDGYVVDTQQVRHATPADAEAAPVWLASSSHPGLRGLVISDVMCALTWRVTDGLAINDVEIATDASLLIVTTASEVYAWRVDVPTSTAAMPRWLASLTNAVGVGPDDTIVWP